MKRHSKDAPVPPAPSGLSPEAVRWWERLHREFDLDDQAAHFLLEAALRAFDRANEAARLIDEHGIAIKDRFGQLRANPAVAAERDARAQMLAAFRQLGLDIIPPGPVGRPPGK